MDDDPQHKAAQAIKLLRVLALAFASLAALCVVLSLIS